MRRTKIICTLGPSSATYDDIEKLVLQGMDVARLNFSHGTVEEHSQKMDFVRKAATTQGRLVAVLLDLPGPKIRVGMMKGGRVKLEEGKKLILTTINVEGTADKITVNYAKFPELVSEGSKVYLSDGAIELKVLGKKGNNVSCQVVIGGELFNRKGANLPSVRVKLPPITARDLLGIELAKKKKVDFVAQSFVCSAEDVQKLRKLLGEPKIPIIAKIESIDGVENIDSILEEADAIMVARGDLGVQVPIEDIPSIQKSIIKKCNAVAKPVITATQMLESMIHSPNPTRAEATDVANAILDGTDAIMLSAETANGFYPFRAVEMMSKIAVKTEQCYCQKGSYKCEHQHKNGQEVNVPDAISKAIVGVAHDLNAKAIITCTVEGHTTRYISKYRPNQKIIAATPNIREVNKLILSWGVTPLLVKKPKNTHEMIKHAVQSVVANGLVNKGDLILVAAGIESKKDKANGLMQIMRAE